MPASGQGTKHVMMSSGIKLICRIVAVLIAVPVVAFAFVGPHPQGGRRGLFPPAVVVVPTWPKSVLLQSQWQRGWRLFAVNVIIAGAPASGKGTQCEVIKEKFGVVHLSTGDMLRAAVSAGTEIGKLAKDFMDSGKLVPDDVIIGVVKDRLDASDCRDKGWLLDGFPRTQAQANALAEAGVSADCFLFLDVPDEVLVQRVVGRRTDPVTGKIYHLKFSPPDDEEVLKRLMQRSDDTEEKVKVRLEQFHANVDSVKDSYSDIMVVIDGNRDPSMVSKDIVEAIESRTREAV